MSYSEPHLRQVLQRLGWFVLPPRTAEAQPEPDVAAAADGKQCWAAVLTKSQAVTFRLAQEKRHGIGLRTYEHYRALERQTGCEVWLFICEKDSGQVLYGSLAELARNGQSYLGEKMDDGGMLFFPRSEFVAWNGEESELTALLNRPLALPAPRLQPPMQQLGFWGTR